MLLHIPLLPGCSESHLMLCVLPCSHPFLYFPGELHAALCIWPIACTFSSMSTKQTILHVCHFWRCAVAVFYSMKAGVERKPLSWAVSTPCHC